MLVHIIYGVIIALLVFSLFSVVYVNVKTESKNALLSNQNQTMQERFTLMTKELQDIASLNKFCIDRWQTCVLESQKLNKQNGELLSLVQKIQTK